jgi:hypothetical protein
MNTNFLRSVFLFSLILAGLCRDADGQMDSLIPFILEDQFEILHTEKEFRGYYVILLGGDRKGSGYCFDWSDALREELDTDTLKKRIKILGVADLQAAPSALHNFIKGKFPEEKKYWVLLDWNGVFAKAYQFHPDAANIIIFHPSGKRFYRNSAQEVESGQLNRIISIIHNHVSKQ